MGKLSEAVKAQMAHVEYCRQGAVAMMFVRRVIERPHSPLPPHLEAAFSTLWAAVHERETEAWRNLLMMGLISDTDRKEVVQRAAQRFLRENTAVMDLLDEHGEQPGSWLTDSEAEFRAELQEAISRQTGEGGR